LPAAASLLVHAAGLEALGPFLLGATLLLLLFDVRAARR
jgi:hypothetical protein